MKQPQRRFYRSFSDDFVESPDQNCTVPKDYPWVPQGLRGRFLSGLIYSAALVFSTVYCRVFLHARFRNTRVLRKGAKNGAFIYANHTQPVGDVFLPALAAFPHRIYTVVSPANLALPVIGKILPFLGAIPIPDTVAGMKKFNETMALRLEQNRCITIFPEAHVWEYCSFVRPFPESSFKFPVKYGKPVFCLTATYQKRRFCRRPTLTIFTDGPFYPDPNLSAKAQSADLRDRVVECMQQRSKKSNFDYIEYLPTEDFEKFSS